MLVRRGRFSTMSTTRAAAWLACGTLTLVRIAGSNCLFKSGLMNSSATLTVTMPMDRALFEAPWTIWCDELSSSYRRGSDFDVGGHAGLRLSATSTAPTCGS